MIALLNDFAAFFTTAGTTAAKHKIRWRCILRQAKNRRFAAVPTSTAAVFLSIEACWATPR
ncbi:hypothetical protein PIB30_108034, partial [Stylosanthes scabra]|nr:hypothetical protein [Stylosanthes scabra]